MTVQKQVLNFKARKGFSAAQSREFQRAWSDKAWGIALEKGNYDLSRQHLNFEIGKGGKIQPIDKSVSFPDRMAAMLAARGIKDPNEGLAEPRYRTVVDFLFSGSHNRMTEMAFGTQKVVIEPGDNKENLNVHRCQDIEQWALDLYNWLAGKYGEENIIGFVVHLDETTAHAHAALLPITPEGKLSFKKLFAGKDKIDFARNVAQIHDEVAKVNERWGLSRGTSLTKESSRPMQTHEWRRRMEEDGRELELQAAELDYTVTNLKAEISKAERRIKGLTTMVENKKAELEQLQKKLEELKRQLGNSEGDKTAIEEQIADLEKEQQKVAEQLADKERKLETAKHQLDDLRENIADQEASRDDLQAQRLSLGESIYKDAGILLRDQMLNLVVNDYRQQVASLPEDSQNPFEGSELQYISEKGNELLHCAKLLFLGYVDQATTFAEGHGGGTTSDLKWGRDDDEDDIRWARRCMAQAHQMMRPAGRGRRR